jgi:hypothetical protein
LAEGGSPLLYQHLTITFCLILLTTLPCLQVPGYHDVIKSPMDLGTIAQKLQSKAYRMPEEVRASIAVPAVPSAGSQLNTYGGI